MKTHFLIVLIALASFFTACSRSDNKVEFIIKNSTGKIRKNVPVVIKEKKIQSLLELKKENEQLLIIDENKDTIPYQIDTVDGKKEIAFEIDLTSNQEKKITFTLVEAEKMKSFAKFTNIRLGKDADFDGIFDDIKEETRDTAHKPQSQPVLYQMEGIAWENDKVGFRLYWDSRNGKDVFGKLIETPVLDTVGLPSSKSYHELADWGMDILKVGNSLGAGAIAVLKNDSLFRLGNTKSAHFKLLTEGPVRAIFELTYTGWVIDGENYTLRERISIWKGKYYYHSQLFLDGNINNLKLVTGITNLHIDTSYTAESGTYKILYTHGKQSENHDVLGLAVLVSDDIFENFATSPNDNSDITHTYYVSMKPQHASYYFVAAWEQSNHKFSKIKYFEDYLRNTALELSNPVIVETSN